MASWTYESPAAVRERQARESSGWVWVKCTPQTMPAVGRPVMIWREDFCEPRPAYLRSDGTFGLGTAVYRFVTHWLQPCPPVNVA